jgi:hypothetical protein
MLKGSLIRLRMVTLLVVVLAIALSWVPIAIAAQANRQTAPSGLPAPTRAAPAMASKADTPDRYFSVETITLSDGTQLDRMTISGPPKPPPGHELERAPVSAPELAAPTASRTLPVPTYDWVFGCSAVSASMIGAYWDRNGFPNIYAGPTGGGVMPMDNSIWGTWTDDYNAQYPANPLTASRNGLDGRTIRGSIDDYWVRYLSAADDPYITNGWEEHTWSDAFGDYMKTSQSSYDNVDGSTRFWNYTTSPMQLTCADLESWGYLDDGTVGRKQFYEARGYSVAECYNQKTDNTVLGGFSFAQYKAKIDAGYPVFLNLQGHSVVGIGYDDSTTPETVYLNDTWDYSTHEMPWGGSYAGMQLLSVSIADLNLPTAVDLARFEAWPEPPRIHVQWETANEIDNLGFNLYRAEAAQEDKTRVRLNQELIPTLVPPGSLFGAIYDWVDKYKVRKDRTYLYWLEDMDIYGRASLHGPVEVTLPKNKWR